MVNRGDGLKSIKQETWGGGYFFWLILDASVIHARTERLETAQGNFSGIKGKHFQRAGEKGVKIRNVKKKTLRRFAGGEVRPRGGLRGQEVGCAYVSSKGE